MHYARSSGTPWAVLAWDADLGILDLPTEVGLVEPGAARQSADQRRRLYDALHTDELRQPLFDTASNSFFLPPEYASANCQIGTFIGPWFSSIPATAIVGEAFAVTASVNWNSFNCGPLAFIFYVNGSYAGGGLGGLSYTQNLTISTSGIAQIAVLVRCTDADSVTKSAVADLMVCENTSDTVAKDVMLPWPVKAFERGATLACKDGLTEAQYFTDSFKEIFVGPYYTATNDPCRTQLLYAPGDILYGGIHSHPYFTSNAEYLRGNGCHGETTPLSQSQLTALNNANKNFGIGTPADPGDEQWSNATNTPLYLLVPLGGTVKRRNVNGTVTVLP